MYLIKRFWTKSEILLFIYEQSNINNNWIL